MFIPSILWQFLLPFLIRGLVSFSQTKFSAKNKIHAPKENQCMTLWHFNGFLSHVMIYLFFFGRETRFRPRCWVDIHRNLANNILFLLWKKMQRSDEGLTLETPAFESLYGGQFTLSTQLIMWYLMWYHILAKNSGTSCFPPDPAFSTKTSVFHQIPRFPPKPAFSTRPRVFHTPGPVPLHTLPAPRDSGPAFSTYTRSLACSIARSNPAWWKTRGRGPGARGTGVFNVSNQVNLTVQINVVVVVRMRYYSWHISLPSSSKQQLKMTKFCVVWRR